jgi:hypothetical protein
MDALDGKVPLPRKVLADLMLHVHRTLIHHLSEVCLLRDRHPTSERSNP